MNTFNDLQNPEKLLQHINSVSDMIDSQLTEEAEANMGDFATMIRNVQHMAKYSAQKAVEMKKRNEEYQESDDDLLSDLDDILNDDLDDGNKINDKVDENIEETTDILDDDNSIEEHDVIDFYNHPIPNQICMEYLNYIYDKLNPVSISFIYLIISTMVYLYMV